MIKTVGEYALKKTLANSPSGRNTKFLQASLSLWTRFKNFQKNPPYALYEDDEIKSIIFATISEKSKYVNLYEICTVQGQEGKGYASKIWSEFIAICFEKKMERIKLSCTPSSITWHLRNGLVFWAVDRQGSLRSDQPLMKTREEQKELREKAIYEPQLVLPSKKVCEKLLQEALETQPLSQKQAINTYNAIQHVGKYWLRNYLRNGL